MGDSMGPQVDSSRASDHPVALVTGASRGIGRAIAVSLAADGFHVICTGRTVVEGAGVNPATGRPLPGSLDDTLRAIVEQGGSCRAVVNDILEHDAAERLIDDVWRNEGRLDVLVNNAVYVGGGNDTLLGDNDPSDIERRVTGNLLFPLLLTHHWIRRVITTEPRIDRPWLACLVNVTSDAGQRTPRHVAGRGGWSLTYAATKAGFHRIADMIALEYGHLGVRAVNVDPGLVATERVLDSGSSLEWIARDGATPEAIGEVVAALVRDTSWPNGAYVHAQHHLRANDANGDNRGRRTEDS